MENNNFKSVILSIAFILGITVNIANAATAKISDFKIIHSEATIKTDKTWKYLELNALSDADLKKTVLTPVQGDFITVKKGTMDLRDGNTRVYILMKRGFGSLVVTYDTLETSVKYYDQ